MNRLLADYRFSDRLRYEAHRLVYMPEDEEPLEIRGFLGAAIMAALIVDTDEGDARGVAMDTPAQRDALIARYEQEVRRDNGGLLRTEVEAFCEAHLVLASDQQMLLRICRDSISAPQYAPDRNIQSVPRLGALGGEWLFLPFADGRHSRYQSVRQALCLIQRQTVYYPASDRPSPPAYVRIAPRLTRTRVEPHGRPEGAPR